MVEYRVTGTTHSVEVGANTFERPWVFLTNGNLNGSLGCNDFDGTGVDYDLSEELLVPGQIAWTDKLCGDESLMEVEEMFLDALLTEEIHISLNPGSMTWSAGETRLVFTR